MHSQSSLNSEGEGGTEVVQSPSILVGGYGNELQYEESCNIRRRGSAVNRAAPILPPKPIIGEG